MELENEYITAVDLHFAKLLGKTQTVSTPGAGLKFPKPKSWVSSVTIPGSPASFIVSATTSSSASGSESDWDLATNYQNDSINHHHAIQYNG